MMFGSISVVRSLVRKPGFASSIVAPARWSVNGRCASFVL